MNFDETSQDIKKDPEVFIEIFEKFLVTRN